MKQSPLKRKTGLRRISPLKSTKPWRPKRKRTSYTKTLRDYIKERDGHLCQRCGRPGSDCHHVIPKGRFYSKWYTFDDVNDERNLMYLCRQCHHLATINNQVLEQLIKQQERRFGPLRNSM